MSQDAVKSDPKNSNYIYDRMWLEWNAPNENKVSIDRLDNRKSIKSSQPDTIIIFIHPFTSAVLKVQFPDQTFFY